MYFFLLFQNGTHLKYTPRFNLLKQGLKDEAGLYKKKEKKKTFERESNRHLT